MYLKKYGNRDQYSLRDCLLVHGVKEHGNVDNIVVWNVWIDQAELVNVILKINVDPL